MKRKKRLLMKTNKEPTVGIIMGSKSDWKGVMEHCSEVFKDFGINHDARVISAHRTQKIRKFISAEKNYGNYCSSWRSIWQVSRLL